MLEEAIAGIAWVSSPRLPNRAWSFFVRERKRSWQREKVRKIL